MALRHEVIEILACPACGGKLADKESYLLCTACALKYPVRDGIPVLLLGEAEKAES